MNLLAMAEGLTRGWLDDHVAGPQHNLTEVVMKGWAGLTTRVRPDGKVDGCCMGTGVEPDAAGYDGRGTNWTDAAPGGVAIVLRTAVAVHKLGIA